MTKSMSIYDWESEDDSDDEDLAYENYDYSPDWDRQHDTREELNGER